jgi:hypothetical protein
MSSVAYSHQLPTPNNTQSQASTGNRRSEGQLLRRAREREEKRQMEQGNVLLIEIAHLIF